MSKLNEIYVGLDVHKATIAVAIVHGARGAAHFYGEIENTPQAIAKWVSALSQAGEVLNFCYEAGPCGYELYHQLRALGHPCDAVAPSLIPRKSGVRIKTDRRDALALARLHAAGSLTAVWVPDKEQEGMRDLRACELFDFAAQRLMGPYPCAEIICGVSFASALTRNRKLHRL